MTRQSLATLLLGLICLMLALAVPRELEASPAIWDSGPPGLGRANTDEVAEWHYPMTAGVRMNRPDDSAPSIAEGAPWKPGHR